MNNKLSDTLDQEYDFNKKLLEEIKDIYSTTIKQEKLDQETQRNIIRALKLMTQLTELRNIELDELDEKIRKNS